MALQFWHFGMTRLADVAWAAGLFEGEGCWIARPPGNSFSCSARLAMKDEDIVRRFRDVVGFGSVGQKTYEPFLWSWDAGANFQAFQALGAMFWPWLGERRRARWTGIMEDVRVDRRRRSFGISV